MYLSLQKANFGAVNKSHLELVRLLLRTPDINVNSRDDRDFTPLHVTMHHIKRLGDYYKTPLYTYGALLKDDDYEDRYIILKLLLEQETLNLNLKAHGRTALSIAAVSSTPRILEILVAALNIAKYLRDDFGRTAIHWAFHRKTDEEQVLNIVSDGGKVAIDALTYAVGKFGQRRSRAVLYLIDRVPIDTESKYALINALSMDDDRERKEVVASIRGEIHTRALIDIPFVHYRNIPAHFHLPPVWD